MKREEFISICDKKIKLVRAEYSFSQDKMAKLLILGLSKNHNKKRTQMSAFLLYNENHLKSRVVQ